MFILLTRWLGLFGLMGKSASLDGSRDLAGNGCRTFRPGCRWHSRSTGYSHTIPARMSSS